jgi:hypothetical protein
MANKKRVDIKRILEQTRGIQLSLPNNSAKLQMRMLRKLISSAQHTAFGTEYHYSKLLTTEHLYKAFQLTVPISDYSSMKPWWDMSREGHSDVCWPGKIEYFALSSGTSDGSSKYIPVTNEMIKSIRRVSLKQVLAIARTEVPKNHIAKHWLMIGGSTSLNYHGTYYSGDLSGITTSKIPPVFQRVSKPDNSIKSTADWEEKITRITLEAKKWDVGMVAGVPAWIKILFERIIDHYQLDNIHDIWPHLEVYIHGGVSIMPYKKGLDALMGRPIKYFETYLASEGFIAYQNRVNPENGMKLNLRNGIFYEFVPFNSDNFTDNNEIKQDAQTLPLWETKENEEYAILLSTVSGAWRYLIGDTIRFTNKKRSEIVITGRTKHFISLCGEHLSVENMTMGVNALAEQYGLEIPEFTLSGYEDKNGQFTHHWYLACEELGDFEEWKNFLDQELHRLNDDYATERNHALGQVKLEVFHPDVFMEWMEQKNKVGSQHKFPRVLKGSLYEEWKEFLETKTKQVP